MASRHKNLWCYGTAQEPWLDAMFTINKSGTFNCMVSLWTVCCLQPLFICSLHFIERFPHLVAPHLLHVKKKLSMEVPVFSEIASRQHMLKSSSSEANLQPPEEASWDSFLGPVFDKKSFQLFKVAYSSICSRLGWQVPSNTAGSLWWNGLLSLMPFDAVVRGGYL